MLMESICFIVYLTGKTPCSLVGFVSEEHKAIVSIFREELFFGYFLWTGYLSPNGRVIDELERSGRGLFEALLLNLPRRSA
jgi:hypothetical protein